MNSNLSELIKLQNKAIRHMDLFYKAIIGKNKITPIEFLAISIIKLETEIEPKQLAGRMEVSQAFISQLITSLSNKKLIRVEPCPDDKRVKCLFISNKGNEIIKNIKMEQNKNQRGTLLEYKNTLTKIINLI
jgi:DNA-binding MarR family transcriptional regulator